MSFLRKFGSGLGQAPPSGNVVFPSNQLPVSRKRCSDNDWKVYFGGRYCCDGVGDGRYVCVPLEPEAAAVPSTPQYNPNAFAPQQPGYGPGPYGFRTQTPGGSMTPYAAQQEAGKTDTNTVLLIGAGAVAVYLYLKKQKEAVVEVEPLKRGK